MTIFDEDDPLGMRCYDASYASATAPSELQREGFGGHKLPIETANAFRGSESLRVRWRSNPEGDWRFVLAAPGWAVLDATGQERLVFRANAPAAVPPSALPRVGMQSVGHRQSGLVALREFLGDGIDADIDTWQRVSIPLSRFSVANGFDLSRFQAVIMSQGSVDSEEHTVWLDAVELISDRRELETSDHRLPAPELVGVRAGDRSVLLHWTMPRGACAPAYEVERAESEDGPFSKITTEPVSLPRHADLRVCNDITYWYRITPVAVSGRRGAPSVPLAATPRAFPTDAAFLEYIAQTAFDYFWREADPVTGLVRDRSRPYAPASIAATGFGLTAIGLGAERSWIPREAAVGRVLSILRTLQVQQQGLGEVGTSGYRGWFYHFLQADTGARYGASELSSIDTALLLAGILFVREYFDQPDEQESEIRRLSGELYRRVDWNWMRNGGPLFSHGWRPESGFIRWRWSGYNEAMILYLLALGADQESIPRADWEEWAETYQWDEQYGQRFILFPPLFGHQYSACWIDFRGVTDDHLRPHGISYFENSRRAALAQREYCRLNPGGFKGYGAWAWGLTACDGPGNGPYRGYAARGAPPAQNDDGTLAPTAAGGSIVFVPELSVPTLRHFYHSYRENIWTVYGFRDAFNLQADWWGPDVIGIDQGPILLMIENYRSGLVWKYFMRAPEIQRGLRRAGFSPLEP